MPAYFDGLQRAQFGRVEFPYSNLTLSSSLRHSVHEYRHTPGGSIEGRSRKLYVIHVAAIFDETLNGAKTSGGARGYGSLYPEGLEKLRTFYEKGETRPLTIPTLGTIEARMVSFAQRTDTALRSGERCDFEFLEDQEKDFLLDELIVLKKGGIASAADAMAAAAASSKSLLEQIVGAVDSALQLAGDAYDKVQEVADIAREVRDGVDMRVQVVAAKLEGIANLCQEVERFIESPIHHNLLDAVKNVWASALDMLDAISGASSPQSAVYIVGKTMSIQEVSLALYGTTTKTFDLLSFNSIDEPSRIPAGTRLNYLTNIA